MIAIISDIHGNYPALRAVLSELDRMKPKLVLCLGDIAGYYCLLNECIDALRERPIIRLLGNHDYYLTTGTASTRSRTVNYCLEYQARHINEDRLRWLAEASSTYEEPGLSAVHGGWNDPLDEYISHVSPEYFSGLSGGPCFASGHTHVQVLVNMERTVYCNPGSVGQPRDGDPRAAFATFEDHAFNLHRVEYDIEGMAHAMKLAGFDPYVYESLFKGTRIGGGISRVKTIAE